MRRNSKRGLGRPQDEGGYVLLALLLFLALLAIAAAGVVGDLAFEIRRDREEELLHRGVAYERAVRLYAAKTGRYPNRPEDLLGTSYMRYLRKVYKDPVTGKDFRFLHMADVQGPNGLPGNQNGVPGNPPTANSQLSSNTTGNNTSDQNSTPGNASTTAPTNPNSAPSGDQPGLLIFGVASTSKKTTIREFNHKNRYSDWWFYSIPATNLGFERLEPTPNPAIPQGQPLQSGSNQ